MRNKSTPIISIIFFFSIFILSGCIKTENAINPENSNKWEIYDTNDGLADNSVWSLAEDEDGNIWVGTFNNGVSKFDGENWTTYNVEDGMLNNSVIAIAQDRDGDMWFGTLGGLSILTKSGWINIDILGGNPFQVLSLLRDSEDNIWMGTATMGLMLYDNQSWYQYFDSQCGECNKVNAICEDNSHNIWYGSVGDLKKLKGQNTNSFTTDDGLPAGEIKSIHQDVWGNIWIGSSEGEYVAKYIDGHFSQVSLSNGMPYNYITSIVSDDMGNVWFGLVSSGAAKYNGSYMKAYTQKDGLPDETVVTMLKDSKGCLWFGTLEGGVAKYTLPIN